MSALGHKRTRRGQIVNVRFAPESGHSLRESECLLWANKKTSCCLRDGLVGNGKHISWEM
jgi:hypothetical protein